MPLNIAVIGFGYWGPNIVRNFESAEGAKVVTICDMDEKQRQRAARMYPNIKVTDALSEATSATEVDAVAIVTPVFTHHDLAKQALNNGKHVFVEKPFTATSEEAKELINLAEQKGLVIMVDHTFLFTGAVRKIKELVDQGVLGDLYYYDSTRVNLGLFQHDVNVVWDLAPHDFSIMNYLVNEKPVGLSATGAGHFGRGLEDVAYVSVYFESNMIAHFNVNWLSPVKLRSTLIGGANKMLLWNDLENDEKIKVYDKGVDVRSKEGLYNLLVSYRSGDMFSPRTEMTEALKLEAEYFITCIDKNEKPFNDGAAGLEVVDMLKASDQSIKQKGAFVEL